ncbi:MAG: ABC transporter ATP-binding protein [candidate division KSB1 bacterium]|nr:ABC transporter ATP-binding protein [candidate division KSB1 bacterium]
MSAFEEEKLGKAYDRQLIQRLLPFIRPYWPKVIFAVIALLAASILQLLGPKLTQLGIDQYIHNKDLAGLKTIIFYYLLVLVGLFVSRFAQMYMMEWIGQHIMFDLRRTVFGHLQHLPLSFFNRNPVGRLMTRVTTDVEALNEMFTSGLVAFFGDLLTLSGIIFILFYMHWQLALVTISVVPLLFMVSILFKKKVRDAFRQIRTRIARINAFLQENISGMAVVQLFNREEKNFTRFEKLNRDHLDAFVRTIFYFAVFYPTVSFIGAFATALIIFYGGVKIMAGSLTFGALVAFIQYAFMFFRPISDLSEKYNIMQSAMASSERIFKLLDEKTELELNQPRMRIHGRVHGEIEFRNVWFAYNDEDWVLKDISFRIAPGEKIAIVGATGSGKTTMINLLAGFYPVQKGQIRLDGHDIRSYSLYDLRRQMAIVLQDVFLFAGSIAENIRLGNEAIDNERLRQAAADVNALSFIERLPEGFDTPVKERGASLSVGQRQLLAFARALAFDPAILILDEATSNVDTETEILIQQALERLMRDRTSIIIAHRLSTIQNVDRIIVLHKGEIREIGTHAELLSLEGIYHRLYQLQFARQEREKQLAG